MSWAGFKKSMNRAGTGIMMRTGQVERTIDNEFAEEEAKYRQLEKESQVLQKEAKSYLDSVRSESVAMALASACIPNDAQRLTSFGQNTDPEGLASSQARMAEAIDGMFGDSSDAAMAAGAYRRAVEELDNKTARELDAPYRATVLEPIGKLCSCYTEVNKNIEKRNKKVGGAGAWAVRRRRCRAHFVYHKLRL